MPPGVMRDHFIILSSAGCLVFPSHPPVVGEPHQGFLSCFHHSKWACGWAGLCPPAPRRSNRSWEAQKGWGNDQLLDLISFRESKSHHDGAPGIAAPSFGGRASWGSQCRVAEVSPASSLSTRMSEQTGTLSLL